jgi:hypothetical protein
MSRGLQRRFLSLLNVVDVDTSAVCVNFGQVWLFFSCKWPRWLQETRNAKNWAIICALGPFEATQGTLLLSRLTDRSHIQAAGSRPRRCCCTTTRTAGR